MYVLIQFGTDPTGISCDNSFVCRPRSTDVRDNIAQYTGDDRDYIDASDVRKPAFVHIGI